MNLFITNLISLVLCQSEECRSPLIETKIVRYYGVSGIDERIKIVRGSYNGGTIIGFIEDDWIQSSTKQYVFCLEPVLHTIISMSSSRNGWSDGSYFTIQVYDTEILKHRLLAGNLDEFQFYPSILIPKFSSWKYSNNLYDTNEWTQNTFDDSTWLLASSSSFPLTTTSTRYYRKTFITSIPISQFSIFEIGIYCLEGVRIFVNTKELIRYNLPTTEITPTTSAITHESSYSYHQITGSWYEYIHENTKITVSVEIHPSLSLLPHSDLFDLYFFPLYGQSITRIIPGLYYDDIRVYNSIKDDNSIKNNNHFHNSVDSSLSLQTIENAFDMNIYTHWSCSYPSSRTCSLIYQYPKNRREWINYYSITTTNGTTLYDPHIYFLFGSNNQGNTWTLLHRVSSFPSLSRRTKQEMPLTSNTIAYNMYKIEFSQSDQHEEYLELTEFSLIARYEPFITELKYSSSSFESIASLDSIYITPLLTGNYYYKLIDSTLPNGLNFYEESGEFEGIPTESYNETITIQLVTDVDAYNQSLIKKNYTNNYKYGYSDISNRVISNSSSSLLIKSSILKYINNNNNINNTNTTTTTTFTASSSFKIHLIVRFCDSKTNTKLIITKHSNSHLATAEAFEICDFNNYCIYRQTSEEIGDQSKTLCVPATQYIVRFISIDNNGWEIDSYLTITLITNSLRYIIFRESYVNDRSTDYIINLQFNGPTLPSEWYTAEYIESSDFTHCLEETSEDSKISPPINTNVSTNNIYLNESYNKSFSDPSSTYKSYLITTKSVQIFRRHFFYYVVYPAEAFELVVTSSCSLWIYINGKSVYEYKLPEGDLTIDSVPSEDKLCSIKNAKPLLFPVSLLHDGENVLAFANILPIDTIYPSITPFYYTMRYIHKESNSRTWDMTANLLGYLDIQGDSKQDSIVHNIHNIHKPSSSSPSSSSSSSSSIQNIHTSLYNKPIKSSINNIDDEDINNIIDGKHLTTWRYTDTIFPFSYVSFSISYLNPMRFEYVNKYCIFNNPDNSLEDPVEWTIYGCTPSYRSINSTLVNKHQHGLNTSILNSTYSRLSTINYPSLTNCKVLGEESSIRWNSRSQQKCFYTYSHQELYHSYAFVFTRLDGYSSTSTLSISEIQLFSIDTYSVPSYPLSYTPSIITAYRNTEFPSITNTPFFHGFSILSGTLPLGLYIDSSTGLLYGRPQVLVSSFELVIHAYNMREEESMTLLTITITDCISPLTLLIVTCVNTGYQSFNQMKFELYYSNKTLIDTQNNFPKYSNNYYSYCILPGNYYLQLIDTFNDNWGSSYISISSYDNNEINRYTIGKNESPKWVTFTLKEILRPESILWVYLNPSIFVNLPSNWMKRDFDDYLWTLSTEEHIQPPKGITQYYRTVIDIPDTVYYSGFSFTLRILGGCIVYFNGIEIYRMNMPESITITYDTLALLSYEIVQNVGSSFHIQFSDIPIYQERNILGIELHQGPIPITVNYFSCYYYFYEKEQLVSTGGLYKGINSQLSYNDISKAFDNNINTKWISYNLCADAYAIFKSNNNKRQFITNYVLITGNNCNSRHPSSWKLEGSNDNGQSYDELDIVTNHIFLQYNSHFSRDFIPNKAYSEYKLTFLECNNPSIFNDTDSTCGHGHLQLAEIQFNIKRYENACMRLGDYPPAFHGEESHGKCPQYEDGYSYRTCNNGVFSTVHSENCYVITPLSLSYPSIQSLYYYNHTIQQVVPIYEGIIYTFSIVPELPVGLVFNEVTGIITGIPLITSVNITYTVTASNISGSISTTFSFSITDKYCETEGLWIIAPSPSINILPCESIYMDGNLSRTCSLTTYNGWGPIVHNCTVTPLSIQYSDSNFLFYYNDIINDYIPETSGIIDSYSISPSLPSGLIFNISTGVISGKAINPLYNTSYMVCVFNPLQYASTTVTITILLVTCPEDGIWPETNKGNNVVLDCGNPLYEGSISRVCLNTVPPAWSLPLDNCKYKAPIIDYHTSYHVCYIHETMFSLVPTVSNYISHWTISPLLPIGLEFDKSTGAITGIPTVLSNATLYTIIAGNKDTSTTVTMTIVVSSRFCSEDGIWPNTMSNTTTFVYCDLLKRSVISRHCFWNNTWSYWELPNDSLCLRANKTIRLQQTLSYFRIPIMFTLSPSSIKASDIYAIYSLFDEYIETQLNSSIVFSIYSVSSVMSGKGKVLFIQFQFQSDYQTLQRDTHIIISHIEKSLLNIFHNNSIFLEEQNLKVYSQSSVLIMNDESLIFKKILVFFCLFLLVLVLLYTFYLIYMYISESITTNTHVRRKQSFMLPVSTRYSNIHGI
ncbi:hypothetical protein WA158_001941 [Blastocystis sp. Blastoise]